MSKTKHGQFVLLDETIDHAVWAQDYRYDTLEEAQRQAKKRAWKERRDYYVAELVTGIELRPEVQIDETNLLERKV